jgi:hypothetical protein
VQPSHLQKFEVKSEGEDRKQWQELKDLKYKWDSKKSAETGIPVSSFTRSRSAVTCASAPAAECR